MAGSIGKLACCTVLLLALGACSRPAHDQDSEAPASVMDPGPGQGAKAFLKPDDAAPYAGYPAHVADYGMGPGQGAGDKTGCAGDGGPASPGCEASPQGPADAGAPDGHLPGEGQSR